VAEANKASKQRNRSLLVTESRNGSISSKQASERAAKGKEKVAKSEPSKKERREGVMMMILNLTNTRSIRIEEGIKIIYEYCYLRMKHRDDHYLTSVQFFPSHTLYSIPQCNELYYFIVLPFSPRHT
jgi:hypothetical protein